MNIKTIDLYDVAQSYTELTSKGNGEYYGACPLCKDGTDRFTVHTDKNRWYCRKANESGHAVSGDALDLVQAIEGVSFKQALEIVKTKGYSQLDIVKPAQRAQRAQIDTFDRLYWNSANNTLQDRLQGETWAIGYLQDRGITLETAITAGLGAGYRFGVNAISIPYYDKHSNLVGGRWRMVDGKDRYRIFKGANMAGKLYGWHVMSKGKVDTLILCEGELNALSIWQALDGRVKVLSTGSQNFILTDEVVAQLDQWSNVYLWCDNQNTLDKWRQALPGAQGWTSPVRDGVKYDANALLIQGSLKRGLERKLNA